MAKSLFPLSIERYAAYLDGNIDELSKENIEDLIAHSSALSSIHDIAMVEVSPIEDIDLPSQIEDLSFDLPTLDSFELHGHICDWNMEDFVNIGDEDDVNDDIAEKDSLINNSMSNDSLFDSLTNTLMEE